MRKLEFHSAKSFPSLSAITSSIHTTSLKLMANENPCSKFIFLFHFRGGICTMKQRKSAVAALSTVVVCLLLFVFIHVFLRSVPAFTQHPRILV